MAGRDAIGRQVQINDDFLSSFVLIMVVDKWYQVRVSSAGQSLPRAPRGDLHCVVWIWCGIHKVVKFSPSLWLVCTVPLSCMANGVWGGKGWIGDTFERLH